jgi:putative hemolysin
VRKQKLEILAGQYRIRTIVNSLELDKVLELRSNCFRRNFNADHFELNADHLIVEDMSGPCPLIVGAYRLTGLLKLSDYETAADFPIAHWIGRKKKTLEVSWACTHTGYRQGPVIHMLWRGLSAYLQSAKTEIVFGPATISMLEAKNFFEICKYVRCCGQELKATDLNLDLENDVSCEGDWRALRRKIPPLLRAYLMAGSKVFLQPVYDSEANSYDFLTILNIDQSSESLRAHFQF